MKVLKSILFLSMLISSMYAQTPFVLTGVKSYYPVVELNSEKIDKKYKQILLDMIKEKSAPLGINTDNFSTRSLAFLVSYIGVGDIIALKIDLMLGENMTRADTKEEVFVVSYMNGRLLSVEDLESDLLNNAEDLLDSFTAQYKEDNL